MNRSVQAVQRLLQPGKLSAAGNLDEDRPRSRDARYRIAAYLVAYLRRPHYARGCACHIFVTPADKGLNLGDKLLNIIQELVEFHLIRRV